MALCDRLELQQIESKETHQALIKTILTSLTNTASLRGFSKVWQSISSKFEILFTTEESIEQLKHAILKLALMGKLVPQNPNDEPAGIPFPQDGSGGFSAGYCPSRCIASHPGG